MQRIKFNDITIGLNNNNNNKAHSNTDEKDQQKATDTNNNNNERKFKGENIILNHILFSSQKEKRKPLSRIQSHRIHHLNTTELLEIKKRRRKRQRIYDENRFRSPYTQHITATFQH